ncbi:MAG: hypothetical protein ACR2MA_00445 [Egibacteraceae bacterium]
MPLARSRRSVVVLDAGKPRNAPAAHMHAYLGHDGRSPTEFLALGREEVRRYGAEIIDEAVTSVALASCPTGSPSSPTRTSVSAPRITPASPLVTSRSRAVRWPQS